MALVLAEIGLRVAAAFVGPRTQPATHATGQITVLCVGDSHTYGVHCRQEEAYPGQLQTRLDALYPGRFQVLNLGLPGMNTAQIRHLLPQWIDGHDADIVLFLAGINNLWNRSDTSSLGSGASSLFGGELRLHRLYRLIRYGSLERAIDRSIARQRPDFERTLIAGGNAGEEYHDSATGKLLIRHHGSIHGGYREVAQARSLLRRDLQEIHELTRSQGIELVLLTYAAFPLPGRELRYVNTEAMNEELRIYAAETGLPLVEEREQFLARLPLGVPRLTLFIDERDGHPNPQGYAIMVEQIFEDAGAVFERAQATRAIE